MYHDKLLAEVYGMSIHPAITINGQIYRGDLTGNDIFRAICTSFSSGFKPLECLSEFNVTKELSRHNAVRQFVQPSSGRIPLLLCLIIAAAFNLGIVYLYRHCQTRNQKQEMQE